MKPNKITIHCSDSPHGRGDDAVDIHNWHQERGYDGIGYHYVITEEGKVQRGRPYYWKGAHVKNNNIYNLGICLIGEKDFTDRQYDLALSLTAALCKHFKIAPSQVYGHYELDDKKTCPNLSMVLFRKHLRGILEDDS